MESKAKWLFVAQRDEPLFMRRLLVAIVVAGVVVFGVVVQKDYPADDPLWPDADGEIGLVVFSWFVGWWHDPGY